MKKRLTRKQAIRKKCLDCMAGQVNEVRLCSSKECPLWIYRMGMELRDETLSDSENPSKTDGF